MFTAIAKINAQIKKVEEQHRQLPAAAASVTSDRVLEFMLQMKLFELI